MIIEIHYIRNEVISINNKNNYSEDYEKYKKTGIINPFIFISSDYNQEEEFKPITDQAISGIEPNRYFISNYGNIYDSKKDVYSKGYDSKGYNKFSFNTNIGYISQPVHRVELKTFNPNENHKISKLIILMVIQEIIICIT